MMLQELVNGAKSAARGKKSSRKIEQASVSEDIGTADNAALRLERELAVLLARKPKHRKRPPIADSEDLDHEAPLLLDADEDNDDNPVRYKESLAAPNTTGTVAAEESEVATAENAKPVEKTESETCTRWMQSTRRSRRSNLFRKTASVAITFAVTAFIISVVAIILFGLPNGFKEMIASNDRTAAITSKVGPTEIAKPAPVRMRWVSH